MPLGSFRINSLAKYKAVGGGSTYNSLVTTSNTSPFVTIYNRTGDTFTKLSNPAGAPTDRTWIADWNSDGSLLALGGDADGYFNIYSRTSATAFTKLTQPGTLSTDRVRALHWHPTLNRIAVASSDGNIRIYDVSGTTVTYVTSLSQAGSSNYDVAWNHDGTSIASQGDGAGFQLWNVSGNTFTLLTSHPQYTNTGRSVWWNSDGTTIAIGRDTGPYLVIYTRSGNTFTRIASDFVADGFCYSGCFNSSGNLMAVSAGGICKIFSRSGNTFTDVTPASMSSLSPDSGAGAVSFNNTGTSFAMGSSVSPYIHTWNVSGTTFTKLSNPASLPTGRAYTAKFYPGVKG